MIKKEIFKNHIEIKSFFKEPLITDILRSSSFKNLIVKKSFRTFYSLVTKLEYSLVRRGTVSGSIFILAMFGQDYLPSPTD